MRPLEFYFDYLSPYAYFAWNRVEKFCVEHEVDLVVKPVVFGKLLDHWGHLGPAEIEPKREWLFKYCLFYAQTNDLQLSMPKYHPFNSLYALRASLELVSGKYQRDLVSAIFQAGWGNGLDIGDVEVISKVASGVGLNPDQLKKEIGSSRIKAALKDNTEEAISKGVFGVPSMIYEKHVLWGNDQFEFLSSLIKGTFELDKSLFDDVISRPRAIDRK